MQLETAIAVLALAAYGPPIILAASVALAKRYRREPFGAVVKAFLWGATIAAGIALVVNTFVQGAFVRPAVRDEALVAILVAVLVAPVVEEAVKPIILNIGTVRKNCDEVMDGLIYGAIAGLGFAATENLLYETAALIERGPEGLLATAIARTVSSTLLHAITGSIVGYGISLHLNRPMSGLIVLPFYILAVIIHAAYNAAVTTAPGILILPLIVIVIIGFTYMRRRIHALSHVPLHPDWQRVDDAPDDGAGRGETERPPDRWLRAGEDRPPRW